MDLYQSNCAAPRGCSPVHLQQLASLEDVTRNGSENAGDVEIQGGAAWVYLCSFIGMRSVEFEV